MTYTKLFLYGGVALLIGCLSHTRADGSDTGPQDTGPQDSRVSELDVQVEGRQHHERFVGLWNVEQNTHALFESTFYSFQSDGTIVTGSSFPSDCSGHLAQHCVTGSVANCRPSAGVFCQAEVSCVFGDEWHSINDSLLVIRGICSDGRAREIRLAFSPDSSRNTTSGGDAVLMSVGGENNWSHDNWEWSFRKCAPGTTERNCVP